jgi:hypothetical protein
VGLLRAAGKAAAALPLAQRCLGIKESACGEDHPEVAAALQSLAEITLDMGRWAQQAAADTCMQPSLPSVLHRK